MKMLRRIAALFAVFAIMLTCVPAAYADTDYYIYIPNKNVNLREGPGADYDIKGYTGAPVSLEYLGAQFDNMDILWYKVRDSKGFTGWVSSNVSRRYYKKSAKPKYGRIKYKNDGTLYSDVRSFIADTAYDAKAIGVQVAAIRGSDGRIFDWTYGYSKWGSKEVKKNTKFRAASISKVAVAICALKMQEQDIVGMNKRIDKYWGAKLPKGISLTTLFTHTSTLQYLALKSGKEALLEQLLDAKHYLDGTVGTRDVWGYNNYASSIAAATLELASGTILEDYAHENIFAPMGVDMSFFAGRLGNTSKLATLYEEDHGLELTVSEAKCLLPDGELAVNAGNYIGGLTGSARDVAKMFYMLANDGSYAGEQILSPESVELLEKKYVKASEYGGTFRQALAVRYMKGLYGTKGVYYHTGNAYGVIALASYDPETKNVVVVFTTGASHKRDENGIYKICSDITDMVFRSMDSI
ncbi:MAG: serine hydrolase [Ruminiclostridium sp.]|nr:serine hydrolase [Ruminiclostridium sp.]